MLENAGTPRARITVLHCNTEYPTPMRDVNLRAMITIREAFGVAVGYSDHTLGIEIATRGGRTGRHGDRKAFHAGSRTLPGPDHKASLEPDELKAMVRAIRNIELALGDGIKRASPSELEELGRSGENRLWRQDPSRRGERFSAANLTTKRPGTGLSPMRWDELLGREASRSYERDDAIDP